MWDTTNVLNVRKMYKVPQEILPHLTHLFVAKAVELSGGQYRANMFVVTGISNKTEEPLFSRITSVLVLEETQDVYLVVRKYDTLGFDTHYHAYSDIN